MIDYIKPIYDFQDKIFHVHIKDIKLYPDRLKKVGTMAYPLDYMAISAWKLKIRLLKKRKKTYIIP